MAQNDFMNLLQSMSNSAASNVSAPVDDLAWLLRKAGVPVPQNALLGSDWMAERGLTKPVPQGAASLAGETLGLLAPLAAAAKAPQIAGGLLQMERNALAPRAAGMVGNERGALMYRAGSDYGLTADNGGPTFFSTKSEGAEPFSKKGPIRQADVTPTRTIDAARGDDIALYEQFLKETRSYAGRGSTYRPFWTAEHDFANWLKAKGHKFDAIMFDEPTNIPSMAVYDKGAIKY